MNFKKFIRTACALLSIVLFAGLFTASLSFAAPSASAASDKTDASSDFRGLWVATVYNLDYPSVQTADREKLKSDAVRILDFAKENGYNAIVFQARPCADSFFKSAYFPWSRFLTGTQGKAPENGFDPLEFWVEQAHKRGLELHAWLNPYRVTKKDSATSSAELSQLAENHPARLHPEWTVKYSDGNLYFDPGIPAVRKLIADSVAEIVNNYDIDGIHFDDYFYPGSDFADDKTYKAYGAAYSSVGDFRRASVDALIEEVGSAIKQIDSSCRFGISPFGIWANKKTNPAGSDTRGTQSYYDHYADTRKWVKQNMIDYIAPQLHWDIGNSVSCYQKLLNWWCDTVSGTQVDLYIGQAAYRAQNTDSSSVWYGTSEIERQLELNRKSGKVSGSIFFRYKYLKNNAPLTAAISDFYKKVDTQNSAVSGEQTANTPEKSEISSDKSFISSIIARLLRSTADTIKSMLGTVQQPQPSDPSPAAKDQSETSEKDASDWAVLTIARPSSDISTSYSSFYFTGQSDPSLPLYINGEAVSARSESGFWGQLVPLNSGKNTITVSQDGKTVSRSIYCGSTPSSPKKMDKAGIVASSTFPQSAEYRQVGESITLKCTAPAGSSVIAELYGSTIKLKAASSVSGKLVQCTYSASYKIPPVAGKAQNVNLGSVKYTAQYDGKSYSAVSPANIGVILKNSPFYATVTADLIDTYKTQSTSNGRHTYMTKGMRTFITGMSGNMVRLGGQSCWVAKSGISTGSVSKTVYPVISEPKYILGQKYDRITFKSSEPTSAIAQSDGKTLTLNVSPALSAEAVSLPAGALLSSCEVISGSGFEKYSFAVTNGAKLDGYYVENTADGFTLFLKRRPKADTGSASPLRGITVMLDPGHGGSDNGSIGCAGLNLPEKSVNLNAARKLRSSLEKLGATVIMTRSDDSYISLPDRQSASFGAKPDIFLSVHANSMNDNVDISKIRGISVFYKHSFAAEFAKAVFNGVRSDLNLENKGVNSSNLYVARASWTPSAICEIGFMPNPYDIELMASDKFLDSFAASAANNIVKYFS